MADPTTLIESEVYKGLVAEIELRAQIRLYPAYPRALQQLDRQAIEASGLSIDELQTLLETDRDRLARFSVAKIAKTRGKVAEQDHPPRERPGKSDVDVIIEERGYSRGFLLLTLVEYGLLKGRPSELMGYLAKRRTPHAKKYAAELRELFRASS